MNLASKQEARQLYHPAISLISQPGCFFIPAPPGLNNQPMGSTSYPSIQRESLSGYSLTLNRKKEASRLFLFPVRL
jgi:hypothetical protein